VATFLSENLNESESVNSGSTTLTGYALTNTGVEMSYVGFKDGDSVKRLIPVPAESHVTVAGLSLAYTEGLSIERLRGDGTLVANVDYDSTEPVAPSQDEVEEEE